MTTTIADPLSEAGVSASQLAPELRARYEDLEDVLAEAREHIEPLSEEGFRWRPDPTRWSVSECLSHLNITFDLYLPAIEKSMAKGRAAGRLGEGPERRGRFNGWVIRSLGPPAERRFKAPKKFLPGEPAPKDEVYSAWLQRKTHFAQLLDQANGLDLWRNRLRSPALPILKFSLGEAFALLAIHEGRHVWQARNVIAEPGFPK